jgi:hypothetical protein
LLIDIVLFTGVNQDKHTKDREKTYEHRSKYLKNVNELCLCKLLKKTKMRFFLLQWILAAFLVSHVSNLEAQVKPKSREQQKKELKKKKEEQIKKQKKAEKALKERHLEIQSKETRKQIRQAKRKSDQLNRRKRRY